MAGLVLTIGNKNYSSWSLRPWLVMRHARVPFEEQRIPLYDAGSTEALAEVSPSRLVPVLRDGDLVIWDSLAICEYLAERFSNARLWPTDAAARAVARSVSAQMHSGFATLRAELPMNCRRVVEGFQPSEAARRDIDQVSALWEDCRSRFGVGGPWLFGRFSVADAMFAPVALRFQTYCIETAGRAAAWCESLLAQPAVHEWCNAARAEVEVIDSEEVPDPG